MAPRSLSLRLILYWIVGSTLVFFSTPLTVQIPLAFFWGGDHLHALEVWTTKRARAVVVESIRKNPDGALRVEMTDALRAHIARNPAFRFAVFDPETKAILPGSSDELAANFDQLIGKVDVFGSLFHLTQDANANARGYVRTTFTPYGRLGTIVYGSDFHWDDALYQLHAYLVVENILAYLPLGLVLSLVALLVVRQGLEPLRTAAKKVSRIDVDSLDQPVSEANMPSEVLPFVGAVNSAFRRVNEDVARQRRFAANSAHELRTPLAILSARVEKLEDGIIKREIQRDASRIKTILEQLLVLAQIEARGAPDTAPQIDLRDAIVTTIADYMPIAFDSGRHINFEPSSNPVYIFGYRWAIESVVTNLIDNAMRSEPMGGTIVVRLDSDATVSVIDHGDGVTPADREVIFEPFWRKTDATPGTGLGLAIARELMQKQGGRIWVAETAGGGATFKLAFRACAADV